jgi:hypothetical protein
LPKIIFTAEAQNADWYGDSPKPASGFIPDWYKKMSPWAGEKNKLEFPVGYNMPNATLKRCSPFLDSMLSGYMAILGEDLLVTQSPEGTNLRWRSADQVITGHSLPQFGGLPIPEEYVPDSVYKWQNDWGVSLPRGYSAMFFHPSNRIDLPFYTFSGIVDCDKYDMPVQFPFILKANFEGIIPAGTPVAQIMMIKREDWESQKKEYNKKDSAVRLKNFYRTLIGSYKKNYWSRKNYR